MADTLEKPLDTLRYYRAEADRLRTDYDNRWARNLKLMKGLPVEDTNTKSRVRNRSKLYFRKIWATMWRMVSAFYSIFLRDPEPFKLQGRDVRGDEERAKVLQEVTKYRIDRMNNESYLFLKHIWAFQDIYNYGISVGKLCWEYDALRKQDGPKYILYPPEQAILDLKAETPDQMKFIGFVNYMTKAELKQAKYDNVDKAEKTKVAYNQVRGVRHHGTLDALQNPGNKEYPSPGTYEDQAKEDQYIDSYEVVEWFYQSDGEIKMCVTNGKEKVKLQAEKTSPYGSDMPAVIGLCLTESHKLIGEGFPEPLEGPQESYNMTLNMRKDNVAMALTPHAVVSRFGNVDLNSITQRRTGGVTLADDPSAVAWDRPPDVTRSAYMEAQADDGMMQELSGVTASVQGMSDAGTATESQINLNQGAAKIDLFSAITSETYMRRFYYLLAKFIGKFETDEMILRIANENAKIIRDSDIYDLEFDIDVILNVGFGNMGRDQEIKQALLLLDRGAVYNQSMMQLLQMGAAPPQGIELFNGTQVFKDIIPKLGKKELDKYFIRINQQDKPQGPGDKLANEATAGKFSPQVGDMGNQFPENDLQAGGGGGF